jgi:hypothetical protein
MDIKDVENLRDNVLWLEKRMPGVMTRWQESKPNCEFHTGVIKEICYRLGTIVTDVFDPVSKWLSDYILNREGVLPIADVDGFLRQGIYRIFKFVVVADFFSQNPQYFVPFQVFDKSNISAYTASLKTQKDYQEFIDLLVSKLIGCGEKLNFVFLKLAKTVKTLSPELSNMQNYLQNECAFLRVRALKR